MIVINSLCIAIVVFLAFYFLSAPVSKLFTTQSEPVVTPTVGITKIPSPTPCPTYTQVQGGQWVDSNSGLLWTTEEKERNQRYECN